MAKIRVQVLMEPDTFVFVEELRQKTKTHNTSLMITQIIKNYKNLVQQMDKIHEEKVKKCSLDDLAKKYGVDKPAWKEL